MRVLMLTWEYPPHLVGGLGRHVAELVPVLDAAGIEVQVVTPWLRAGTAYERIGEHSHVYRVETPSMPEYGFVSFAQETNRQLEAMAHQLVQEVGEFDLIHVHDWLTSYAGVSLKYAWRKPLVTTIHATERGRSHGLIHSNHAQTINGLEWWLAHESWRVIVCSNFMAEQLEHYFNTPSDKINVVPNGVHIPEIAWTAEAQAEFRSHYAHESEHLCFTIARLVHEKGVHILIEAIPHVLRECNNIKFVIAGVGHELQQLQHRVMELGIEQRVFFTGFIPDDVRDKLYAVSDMAIFPSLYEPFGIVALEAMASQCPVIVSDTGGLSEVVELHETGLKVHPDNPESLAWGILHTLNHQDWATKRAQNACEVVETVYNWHTIANTTKAVYSDILNEYQASAWGTH